MNIEIIKALKERAKEMLEDNYNRKIGDEEIYTIICELENFYTAYEKEKEKNINAKWYIHQEIVRIEEDIEDYIDDDKEGNKHTIGEFKEDLKHWQDVEKLLNGKSKDELYMDWRKYGEYE